MDTPFLTPLGLSFLLINKTKHKLSRGPSNEYSYQAWFQFSQWLQRKRLKCNSLWTTTSDGMTLWVS